jgi:hypothetical protein
MYRLKLVTLTAFTIICAVAAFQYLEMPTNPDYYARFVSKMIAGLEREYGKSAVAASIFAIGIFSFMALKRRT